MTDKLKRNIFLGFIAVVGLLFVVYLAGASLSPWTGWAVARFGRRRFVIRVLAVWAVTELVARGALLDAVGR